MKRNALIFAVLFVLATVSTTVSTPAAEIVFHARPVTVTGSVVTLGDVARIDTQAHEDLRSLEQILLFPAPEAGERKSVRLLELRDKLTDLGVRSTHNIVTGPERLVVVGAEPAKRSDNLGTGQENTKVSDTSHLNETVRDAVRPATYDRAEKVENPDTPVSRGNPLRQDRQRDATRRPPSSAEIRLLESQLVAALRTYLDRCVATEPGRVDSHPWDIRLTLTPTQAKTISESGMIAEIFGGRNPITGPQRFEIEMDAPDERTGEPVVVAVDAVVALPVEVLVMSRSVPKGHLICEADIELVERLPGELRENGTIVDPTLVLGKETTAPLRAGAAITPAMVRSPVVIRKGEVIQVTAVNGGIRITLQAVAKQDAAVGEPVLVEYRVSDPDARGRKEEVRSFVATASDYKQAVKYVGSTNVIR